MTNETDDVLAALHAGSDELAALVDSMNGTHLEWTSGASEWTVAAVLSHLGSGAVITKATLEASLAGEPNPGGDANRAVWAQWDAMSPQEQADGYLAADAALLAWCDALEQSTRENLQVDMGFLPAPVPLATALRFRLNELALHSWDARVAIDSEVVLEPSAVPLLLEQAALMLGFVAKPLDGPGADLLVDLGDQRFGLTVGEQIRLGEAPSSPDGVLTVPAEAWLRLVGGRLGPEHTPSEVTVTGPVTLDDLRRVFPGF